jgi:hypothetical protein
VPRQSTCDNPACNHKILKSHESYWERHPGEPDAMTFCRKCWPLIPRLIRELKEKNR